MKRLTTLLMSLVLLGTMAWADQTITVSANSSDISEGLDLKVVAKLFAQAENLEQFEMMLNNPDSAFCNLDLNGDGQVDYLRVIETGEGNKRLIVLQAVLAKDIYQDVASIYVEKDEANQVSVQIIGDEYVYGTNYIIEPVYIYRPVIYDWFWSPSWYAWRSPWYWDYYPSWWYYHNCWAYDWYWHRCYTYHHHHHHCSFRPGHSVRNGYHDMHTNVARHDYAVAHPESSFSRRNDGRTNAREIHGSTQVSAGSARQPVANRTYGSTHTASARSQSMGAAQVSGRSSSRSDVSTTQRITTNTESQRATNVTATRTSGIVTSQRAAGTVTSSRSTATTATTTRSTASSARTTTAARSTATTSRPSSTTSRSTAVSSGSRSSSGSYSGSSRSSSGSYSGSSRSGSSGGYSGGSSSGSSRSGGSSSSGGGSSRSGGSSGSVRR